MVQNAKPLVSTMADDTTPLNYVHNIHYLQYIRKLYKILIAFSNS